jgi:biopolymer transport protein TolR
MPAVSMRGARRRTINEINMVPFIDVMLVLLIIFMVTAPLITTGVVDLPTVGKSGQAKPRFVELQIGTDEACACVWRARRSVAPPSPTSPRR